MSQSSNNTVLGSIAVLVILALGVAWYVNTHSAPAPSTTSTSSVSL
jgi:hypothetical protein